MVKASISASVLLLAAALAASGCATSEAQPPDLQDYVMQNMTGPDRVGEEIALAVDDAMTRLNQKTGQKIRREMLRVYSWPQAWSDGTLGMGGIGFQAITIAQTVMVLHPESGWVVEYRGGRFHELRPAKKTMFKRRAP